MTLKSSLARLLGRATARDVPRVVVVDTETTGLDAERDALVELGAVAVDAAGIVPDDSFEAVVHSDRPVDPRNAALHGVGAAAQAGGTPLAEALGAFAAYVAGSPLVGFHADFDRRVLKRAFAAAHTAFDERPWLDLAALAASLDTARWNGGARSLDDWLAAYGIPNDARHSAAGDALATAELYLRLRATAKAQGAAGHAALLRAAGQRRWLGA